MNGKATCRPSARRPGATASSACANCRVKRSSSPRAIRIWRPISAGRTVPELSCHSGRRGRQVSRSRTSRIPASEQHPPDSGRGAFWLRSPQTTVVAADKDERRSHGKRHDDNGECPRGGHAAAAPAYFNDDLRGSFNTHFTPLHLNCLFEDFEV